MGLLLRLYETVETGALGRLGLVEVLQDVSAVGQTNKFGENDKIIIYKGIFGNAFLKESFDEADLLNNFELNQIQKSLLLFFLNKMHTKLLQY